MKQFVALLGILMLVACEQDKIGFVDYVKLMDGYQEKIDVENKFKTKAEALTRKRDSISQAFDLELKAFQTKAQSLSQQKAQEEYGLIQQRAQFMGQQLQQEEQLLQSSGQTELDSVVSKVKKEISAFGKTKGYTYILGGGEVGSVLYGAETKDLTKEILVILNEKYSN
ncbi:MAG: OmpH family outer membrane protein [Bacteroidota bacterium]